MRLIFKQRMFSWLDSYDVYDERGNVYFRVKGKLSFGHCLEIYDSEGRSCGTVKEVLFTFLPRFEIYAGGEFIGSISRRLSLWRSKYDIDFLGWQVTGDIWDWDYQIRDSRGNVRALIYKQIFHFTDTYVLDVVDTKDVLYVLMFVIAMDAEKCSDAND